MCLHRIPTFPSLGSPGRSVAEDHEHGRFCRHSQVLPWLEGEAGKGSRGESLPRACQI